MNLSEWRRSNARQIAEDIRHRNYGRFPTDVDEWREVANRYGCFLMVLALPPSVSAMRVDNLIVIRHTRHERLLRRRIVHEIAEVVALRDGGIPPCNYQSGFDEPHIVAQIAEAEEV